jgi:mannose-6-phosphate isomerase-like protein (cupin superfamily)
LPTTANPTEEHDLFRAGDTIENPVTGERIVFRQTAAETGGESVVVETHVKPGGAVATAHIHPGQDERFRVLDGRLGLRVGGESLELGPGESATVPAGTVHKFWNAGDEEARFVAEVRPALNFEPLLATMFSLATEGKTNRKGLPNPLRLAVIARAYFDTVRLPFPPASLQRLVLALAAPFGGLLGYRPHPSTSSAAASPTVAPIMRRHGLASAAGHQGL